MRMIGAGLDITERKRAEQALIKSESRLVEAQRVGHVGSWEWDIVGGTSSGPMRSTVSSGFSPSSFDRTIRFFSQASIRMIARRFGRP